MPRKKKKEKDESLENLVKVVGTPTMMFLPARNYRFKVYKKDYSIKIPRRGVYKDFDSEVFSEKDGEFDILRCDEDSNSYSLYIPSISKVLFAASQYPALKDNQAFTPLVMLIREDEIEIIGNIIEMLRGEEN